MTDSSIQNKLSELNYPCGLVVYGPARDFRTTYRREHHGCFATEIVENKEQAWGLINEVNYPGLYDEMTIRAYHIQCDENNNPFVDYTDII